jgi:hypothetical protein
MTLKNNLFILNLEINFKHTALNTISDGHISIILHISCGSIFLLINLRRFNPSESVK